MDFCPNCGTRLTLTRKKKEKVLQLTCPKKKCGYKKRAPPAVIPKVIECVPSIAVIGKEERKLRTLPTIRIRCPKCGHNRAYVWQVQTRKSEESSTQFFRCTKCNYTFREYS